MLRPFLVAGLLWFSVASFASNLLQKTAQNVDIASSLVLGQGWVRYPSYSERNAWAGLLGDFCPSIIVRGEKVQSSPWVDIYDEDYLAYSITGDRYKMEDKLRGNAEKLGLLLIAELAEGKGRFLPDIASGVEWFCRLPSWAVVAHLAKYQKSKSPLPDPSDNILALYQGNISQLLSWVHYFLHEQLEGQVPGLSVKLRNELQKRELDPYLERNDFWWMGFETPPGKLLNNWNPWCNMNALLCYMLLEQDRNLLAAAVEKTMRSVDLYLNGLSGDGCCDEGVEYWYKSTGYLMDYCNCLNLVTGGKLSVWDNPFIRRLGLYIVNADIGDNWQVNYADGTASEKPQSAVIFRFGKSAGDAQMKGFALNSFKKNGADPLGADWTRFYQALENLLAVKEMKALPPCEYEPGNYAFYPEAEVAFFRQGKAFLAAKGGSNFERHNHNDVGSCIYFYDSKPVLVDAGVGTYTRDTFGPRRYENWFVRSGWHNLPVINGCEQVFGGQYKASDSRANEGESRFSTDIARAYPDSAEVKSWKIQYTLGKGGSLEVKHDFSLKEAREPNVLHYLVNDMPVVGKAGQIELGGGMILRYNPNQLVASVEEKSLVGLGFSPRRGEAIYRISLAAKRLQKKGKYVIEFAPSALESLSQIRERVAGLALEQYRLLDGRLAADLSPRGLCPDGSFKDGKIGSWTSGFFPGTLWQLYQLTKSPDVLAMAERRTLALEKLLSYPQSHDLGFQVQCSYGNAYKITGDAKYLPLIKDGAAALASRFNPVVGATLSWSEGEKGAAYPVIIDNMMNLELLEYASKLFSSDSLDNIAVKHAETTIKNHFRPDYSSYHMLDYDASTGAVRRKATVQGYADESAWARGQAWALYGYTMMFRETGKPKFLSQAENIARMILSRLPEDGIPYWDFDDPDIPDTYKDASAAAVMCSAFIELSALTKDAELSGKCRSMAEKQLCTLASPQYLAAPGENGCFLLKHSVGNLPGGSEIDTPLIYADYYFLEALVRYKDL